MKKVKTLKRQKGTLQLSLAVALSVFALSCSPKKSQTVEMSSLAASSPQKIMTEVLSEALVVSMASKDKGSQLVSLKLSYKGKPQLEKTLAEHKQIIENLLRTSLAEFSYPEIKESKVQERAQKLILNNLNSFIADQKFFSVQLMNFKEI